ncbi:MAG TPA: PilN domain-containing protein [Thermodesulfobacteriota bacterium]|nr:PilN domain-containing protein [Thermodesulfobacteriota bacterium]
MIRINLLPVRAAKKKESIRFQMTVAGLIIVMALIILAGVFIKLRSDVSELKGNIAAGEKELKELEVKVGELAKLKDEKRVVQGKLDVVRQLESARSGPVNLFNMISDAVPEKAWLSSLADTGGIIAIKGSALNDEVLAEFMRRLEAYKGKGIGKVELIVARRVKSSAPGVADIVDFSLNLDRR